MKVVMVQSQEIIAKQHVIDALEGRIVKVKPSVKIVKDHGRKWDEAKDLSELIDWYMVGVSKDLYLRFAYMWKGYHKEPFLGKSLPKKILSSCKQHLKHDDLKQYSIIPEEMLKDVASEGSAQV